MSTRTGTEQPRSYLLPTAYQREPARSFNRCHCPPGAQHIEPFTQIHPIRCPLLRPINMAHERVDACRRRRPGDGDISEGGPMEWVPGAHGRSPSLDAATSKCLVPSALISCPRPSALLAPISAPSTARPHLRRPNTMLLV
ncbi:uncharacterized protein LAESUDRAFT_765195 [Laetiporus sulphureus 93-53]|uniref:Uncharacterized protein n=1 Tax=Laetiporus sulphureus 93-53 TaxID=1314785 RepID=A0A165AWF6_9APHY|nr:uncharacterized protein LAESUDRAFT_765195 [Laetiporus sulphureus 93-53]KZS99786.1 hypothetical protein LAESUDRAFT_765195 [Laetiporus sulphureus 93-53]